MNTILQLILITITAIFCLFILAVTRKKKLSYKYTLLWLLFGVVTLLCAIFPSIVTNLAGLLHIKEPTNALFLIYIFFMIILIFYISIALSKMNEKLTKLIQRSAILEYEITKEREKNKTENNQKLLGRTSEKNENN